METYVLATAIALVPLSFFWTVRIILRELRQSREESRAHQEAFLAVAESIAATEPGVPVERVETQDERIAEIIGEMVALASKVDILPHTWEEMFHKVRRTEERTRGAVKRARQQLANAGLDPDEELEGTWAGLQSPDGVGGDEGGMPSVPEGVGNGAATPEDFRTLALRRKYGA